MARIEEDQGEGEWRGWDGRSSQKPAARSEKLGVQWKKLEKNRGCGK